MSSAQHLSTGTKTNKNNLNRSLVGTETPVLSEVRRRKVLLDKGSVDEWGGRVWKTNGQIRELRHNEIDLYFQLLRRLRQGNRS